MKKILFILLVSQAFVISIFNTLFAHELPIYNISVNIDVDKKILHGISIIENLKETDLIFFVENLKIISIKSNSKEIPINIKDNFLRLNVTDKVEIQYMLEIQSLDDTDKNSIKKRGEIKNFITEKEIYLIGNWYPEIKGLKYYNLKVTLPSVYNVVSEADDILKNVINDKAEFTIQLKKPINKLNIISTKTKEYLEKYKDINIHLYSETLENRTRDSLLKQVKSSIDFYTEYFGKYPNKSLRILESTYNFDFSYPGIVVFNRRFIQNDGILEEYIFTKIANHWFGGFVYVDDTEGDWSKGLSLFLYRKYYKKGEISFKDVLFDYSNYVNPENEISLKEYKSDDTRKIIGYGKGAMVFNMLENILGRDQFLEGLRTLATQYAYKNASWTDLRATFEKVSNKDLNSFFDSWINKRCIPTIEIQNARYAILNGLPSITFDLNQKEQEFIFNIDLSIITKSNKISKTLEIRKGSQRFVIPVDDEPLELVFDEGYNVLRRLYNDEYPVVLAGFLGDSKKLVATSEDSRYVDFIKSLNIRDFKEKDEIDITDEDIRAHSMIIFRNGDNLLLKRLFGDISDFEADNSTFVMSVRKNPLNPLKFIVIFSGDPKNVDKRFFEDIDLFRNYSKLRFRDGIELESSLNTQPGIRIKIYEPIMILQPKKISKIEDIIDSLVDKPIIYIGERHTNFEDHKTQLKIIMELHKRGRKIAIGMEMFQKPFQRYIDDYISGSISERDFLKMTQYYKRWQYDYIHYRDIIEFARSNKLKVIALNLWSEIVNKVATKGIDSLTFEERLEIPIDMDMTDELYIDRLKEIFKQHKTREGRDFNNFYQAQIIWDETMAHNIDEFLKKNPDYQIVVLAGVGHLMYNSGIPKRAFRLNKKEYVTIIPNIDDTSEGVADFIFLSNEIQPPETYKLGVAVKNQGRYVKVEKIAPRSIAEGAGILEGDIIISIDDWQIDDIDDIKIAMLGKNRGDSIKIKVLRRGFLVGYKELELVGTI
jgi:uncharacterized iron-regulated protein